MLALPLPEWILLGLYPVVLCAAIGTDIARRVIPNAIVAALVLGFAILAASTRLDDLSLRLLVCCAVTALGFSLFAQDLIGAGDAKLAGALMLWLDPLHVPVFALLCGLIGGGLALALGVRLRRTPAGLALAQGHGSGEAVSLPYGVALAGAALLIHPYSGLMRFV